MSESKYVFKAPKTIGACADRLYTLKSEKSKAQAAVDKLDAEEKFIKNHIINTLPKSEATGVAGKLARVTVITAEVPQVKDWTAFYAYVKKTNSFDMLQRRLSEAAVRERWDSKKAVPGVEAFAVTKVSLNKV